MKLYLAFAILSLFQFFGNKASAQALCRDLFEMPFVGIVDGHAHIRGSSHQYHKEWNSLPQKAEDLALMNSSQFRFLVHAGSTDKKVDLLLENNKYLQQSFHLSASLIDQNHRITYGKYGFVIAAPPENIIATSSKDMGSTLGKIVPEAEVQKIRDEEFYYSYLMFANPVKSPLELLTETKTYNEILVAGTTTSAGPTKIIGIFLKTKNGQIVEHSEVVEKLKALASKLQIPILEIEAMPGEYQHL